MANNNVAGCSDPADYIQPDPSEISARIHTTILHVSGASLQLFVQPSPNLHSLFSAARENLQTFSSKQPRYDAGT